MAQTVVDLLAAGRGGDAAIAAPDRPALTFDGLRAHAASTVERLNALGFGRGDRIAIVLPNGPEMAATFICVAAGATTAPLNPAYRAEEYDFYLGDLGARALVLPQDFDSPARAVAEARGIPVLSLTVPDGAAAGVFVLEPPSGRSAGRPAARGFAGPGDVGLMLHTSGTTSRPKLVPLLQRNLAASARHICTTLGLTAEDRCLNIMPLFHIHGLIAAVLSSLAAGASVSCTPGFNALRFFGWLASERPTWYTAVPTMHQAILARGARQPDAAKAAGLRLIRSSSASLPAPVMHELEALFAAPVIESYGMTEAAHQMTSNPLPPGERRPGSVGIAAGPEVAIMDEEGRLLPPGELGEVVIRGPNVTPGYENNPDANAAAFAHGWFRTGDQGSIDAKGYLTLSDRLKEIINRGGEKVSPREVDTVLMEHPAVAQVVTFGMPHRMLGEDVAAAVVLRDGAAADEAELRAYAAGRLADFKVPRRILLLDEIPKGATGKLQRIGLATKLGLDAGQPAG